jgi:peptidoglycan/LPS O-acetylase OafA/YrhL
MGLLSRPGVVFPWLDLIRGLAALEVFLAHLRTLFFENFLFGQKTILKSIFYYSTGFSHQAVIIFFVLSGFLIGRTVHFSVEAGRFSVKNYAIDRLVRLWIVLLPALLLTLGADSVGRHLFPDGYTASPSNLGILPFTGNLFFLQNFLVRPYGTNMPLWSLCNEFWYYALFPLVYFLVRKKDFGLKTALAAATVCILLFVGSEVSSYFLIWLMGVAAAGLHLRFRSVSGTVLLSILLPVSVLGLWMLNYTRTGGLVSFGYDFLMGILMALLVFCAVNIKMRNGVLRRTAAFLSGISYSLYVIHMPLIIFLGSWLARARKPWTVESVVLYSVIVIVIFGFIIIWWFLFESRYKPLRAALKKGIFVNRPFSNQ